MVQSWTILELVLGVARGGGLVDQGGLRDGGAAVVCLEALDAEY